MSRKERKKDIWLTKSIKSSKNHFPRQEAKELFSCFGICNWPGNESWNLHSSRKDSNRHFLSHLCYSLNPKKHSRTNKSQILHQLFTWVFLIFLKGCTCRSARGSSKKEPRFMIFSISQEWKRGKKAGFWVTYFCISLSKKASHDSFSR